jgi:hypothetical protein
LKEEALDRIKWRNRFGKDCGPVVWQITDGWMNWDISLQISVSHVAVYLVIVLLKQIHKQHCKC